jgi:4'-phosphopantetheinyl transferase
MTRLSLDPGSIEPVGLGARDLLENEVHVWRASLTEAAQVPALLGMLDDTELERAHRFRFERDRRRFMAGRGLLRQILGSYLQVSPRALRFAYTPAGKPYLPLPATLRFNLSHAADVFVLAVTQNRELGIDVEQSPLDVAAESTAQLVLSPVELAALQGSPPAESSLIFARLWTRKEAYIKADGRGMSLRLDYIDVESLPGGVLVYNTESEAWEVSPSWKLHTDSLLPDCICSLAVEGANWTPVWKDWSTEACFRSLGSPRRSCSAPKCVPAGEAAFLGHSSDR